MIIDFHTHTFPDKIAEQTIAYLAEKGNIKPFREGTLSSLKESMRKANIDYSVVLPVATAPRQVPSINRLAAELNGKDGIIYAGAIHPDCDDIEDVLDEIKEMGLFGIKIHPDYQGVYFDDDRFLHILESAAKRNLLIVTHAGLDVGFPNDIHCTPDRILRALDAVGSVLDDKLVLAHLGGYTIPDEVIEKLAGKKVYMDTAVVLQWQPEKCKEVILAHGTNRILFATDSPWGDQKQFVSILKDFHFEKEDEENIFYNNAKHLLMKHGQTIS